MPDTTPIPSSPIPQPTPKIGTRYVAVSREADAKSTRCYTSDAYFDVTYPTKAYQACDIYALLDPADAAELERLRKVEESAADRHIEDANLGTPEQASASFAAWVKVRDERIAFEKKIGGGK
jgi:hypothetical protein